MLQPRHRLRALNGFVFLDKPMKINYCRTARAERDRAQTGSCSIGVPIHLPSPDYMAENCVQLAVGGRTPCFKDTSKCKK